MNIKKTLLSDEMELNTTTKSELVDFFEILSRREIKEVVVDKVYYITGTKKNPPFKEINISRIGGDFDKETVVPEVTTLVIKDREELDEAVETGFVIKTVEGEYYFMSDSVYFTLTSKVGISLANLASKDAETMAKKAMLLDVLMRNQKYRFGFVKEDDFARVFVIGSTAYNHINATELKDLVESLDGGALGVSDLTYATANQDMTEVVLSYPVVPTTYGGQDINEVYQKFGFSPAVVIQTSDNGHSAYRAMAVWVKNGHYFVEDSHSRQHRYEVNLKKLRKDIEKNIFTKFTELLPRLNELANEICSFGDPQAIKDAIDTLIDKAADKLPKKETWASKKLIKELKSQVYTKMAANYDFSDPITMADVVVTILGSVEWFKLPASHETDFKTFIGTIPYV